MYILAYRYICDGISPHWRFHTVSVSELMIDRLYKTCLDKCPDDIQYALHYWGVN